MAPPRKPNQNPLLDFRSIRDDAWYTVDKLVLIKKNNTLTVRFNEFGRDHDEKFNVNDFKTDNDLDEFVKRFRPACVQLQDEECKNLKRLSLVCALLEESEQNHKFYNGFIESIHREPHTRKGRQERCSCALVVGWLEGPKAGETEQMRLERMCKIQPGSPLFDHALACFMKMSRAQLDLVSNGNHMPVKKEVPSRVQRRSNSLSKKSSQAKSEFTSAKKFGQSCKVHTKNEETTLLEKSLQGNNEINVEATMKDKDLGLISMTPEVLDRVDGSYFILIENLEKDLDPLTIMSFLFNHVTIICQAFVFPSLSSDSSTRGIIVVDTKEKLNRLLKYLQNPDQLIISSRGRPWVISDAKPRDEAFGNLWSKVEVLRGSELRVVSRGTDEFKKGKQLLEIFTNSTIRLKGLHKSVISEEEKVLRQYDTRSRKKLKGTAEHKRIKSQ